MSSALELKRVNTRDERKSTRGRRRTRRVRRPRAQPASAMDELVNTGEATLDGLSARKELDGAFKEMMEKALAVSPVDGFMDLTAFIGGELFSQWMPCLGKAGDQTKFTALELNAEHFKVLRANQVKVKAHKDDAKSQLRAPAEFVHNLEIVNASAYEYARHMPADCKSVGVYMDFPWDRDSDGKLVLDPVRAPAKDASHPKGLVSDLAGEVLQHPCVQWVVAKLPRCTTTNFVNEKKEFEAAVAKAAKAKTVKCEWTAACRQGRRSPTYHFCLMSL